MVLYAFILTGKSIGGGINWVERERNGKRTTRQDSNLGRREHSCAACQCTNHEAIGADI